MRVPLPALTEAIVQVLGITSTCLGLAVHAGSCHFWSLI